MVVTFVSLVGVRPAVLIVANRRNERNQNQMSSYLAAGAIAQCLLGLMTWPSSSSSKVRPKASVIDAPASHPRGKLSARVVRRREGIVTFSAVVRTSGTDGLRNESVLVVKQSN